MATYWVTFRIEDVIVGGNTYDDRRTAFYKAIEKICTKWWLPSTSFVVFESDTDINSVCAAIRAPLSRAHDLFLLGMPEFKSARIFGKNDDNDIYDLIDFLKDG